MNRATHFDVIIVGAGLSGIGAAYHLQKRCPKMSYIILEGRERLGGTWDFFRYPGIRSDSDMYTLGYSFRPWTNPQAIADGPSILSYIRETAELYGIDKQIRYQQKVESASWSSEHSLWSLSIREGSGALLHMTCGFLFMCAGYYDYNQGYTPELPGRERFQGPVIHPQQWTPDIDYKDRQVVVIGSGATAVTLVPELAKQAAHVTMLQRSPTYVISRPERDAMANLLRQVLPSKAAYAVTRWKNVLLNMGFYSYCKKFPQSAKRLLVWQAKRALRGSTEGENFTPSYNPWEQRLCLVPDGDLFRALRSGKASVVTDQIESFTETGLQLRSGKELAADLIVTATGLKVMLLGGMQLEVDGKKIDPAKSMIYRGLMWSDVPNMAMAIGYSNASWTLKCDLTSEYVCRLLNYMDLKGYKQCVTRLPVTPDGEALETLPIIDLASGYIERAKGQVPTQGVEAPWRVHQNYFLDLMLIRHAQLDDGVLQFYKSKAA